MIGHPMQWKEIASDRGFKTVEDMILYFRREGMTWSSISFELCVSTGAIYSKAMKLVESGKIKLADLKRGERDDED